MYVVASLTLLAGQAATEAAPGRSAWKAGVAAVDITPDKPVWMAGYSARKTQSEGATSRLHAKALVLDDRSGKKAVLVTTDLLGLTGRVANQIAAEARRRYGISRDRLMLNSSHTHCGPVIDDMLAVAYDLTPQQWHDVDDQNSRCHRRGLEAAASRHAYLWSWDG